MKTASSITELIGNTPLLYLKKLPNIEGAKADIAVKLESFNPCSSIKDRIGLSMIEAAEKEGKVSKATVFIEPTSGNTGIGLAMVCAAKGYKITIVMPENMSEERKKIMRALGADLILTPKEKGMKGAVETAEKLTRENKNYIMLNQFENPANPEIHEKTTAMEIWNDTGGKVDVVVAGTGTGGTVTGTGRKLKELKKSITVVAVEPAESPVLSGGKPGPHKIQGMGPGFVPKVFDSKVVDEIMHVNYEDSAKTARMAAKTEGLVCGISSGAVLHAAVELSKRPEYIGKLIVAILPDTGERYLSTDLYN